MVGIIDTEKQYHEALHLVERLLDAHPDSKEGKELRLLLLVIEKYEDEHFSIDSPNPIEAIKIRMEDLGLKNKDLVKSIGDKGTVSKVLNYKTSLSLKMIRNLSKQLSIPADVLIKESTPAV
ncbi:MAG: transcriptional regulator [Imperialibacter sp.]|uniref:helix-turn-helix domain-containing protein n=1 Tax=Imperialibacter sp. TaxID=2038411 RepID=UPI0032F05E99